MSTPFPEDRVFARHRRRTGAVLIVGAGAVGSLTAQVLARAGISPLYLLDKDTLEVENVVRHYLGAEDVGKSKARATAERLHREVPWCHAQGLGMDFLGLSPESQSVLVQMVDVVVAATDEAACQRRVNAACLAAGVPAVFPAVWVDPQRVRDAEVGEILWMVPGGGTPCYECWVSFRRASADAQAARGAGLDIQQVSLATAQVVLALLEPRNPSSAILDPDRTAVYVHGLTPTSPGVQAAFPTGGLYSRNVRVPFPPTPCRVCHRQAGRPAGAARRQAAPSPAEIALALADRLNPDRRPPASLLAFIAILALILLIVIIVALSHAPAVVVG